MKDDSGSQAYVFVILLNADNGYQTQVKARK